MIAVHIKRFYEEKQTLGQVTVFDAVTMEVKAVFKSLELPWLDNQLSVSCIPEGKYLIKRRDSEKYNKHFIVYDAKTKSHPYPRTFILIHTLNYVSQTEGCIGIGKSFADINGDGLTDITSSRVALDELIKLLKSQEYTELYIES